LNAMKIELKRTDEDFSRTIHLRESAEDLNLQADGVEFEKPVKVDLIVSKSKDQLICRGQITAPVRLECSRCLLKFEEEQSADLDFVIDLSGIWEQTNPEEDNYFVADPSSSYFVLDDLVREAIILSLPLKPLCSEECKGLCPVCGTDLNRSPCHCVVVKTDPRWDKLKVLLKKETQAKRSKR
jgi:uncharacterized protein